MENERKKAIQTALRLLGVRDYTVTELKDKLIQRNFGPESIADTISECIRSGYVNDASFAERFMHGMMRKGYGRDRIHLAMRRKGFPREIIDSSLHGRSDEAMELKIIQDLAAKHKRAARPAATAIREKQRLYRFLRNRGYPDALIRKALWRNGQAEDPEDG